MKTKKGIVAVICCIIAAVAAILLFTSVPGGTYEKSDIYPLLKTYMTSERDAGEEPSFEEPSFAEDSAEGLFLLGAKEAALGNYEEAGALFEKAAKLDFSDPALPFCIYFYLNLCEYQITGLGDPELIEAALNAAGDYFPAAGDCRLIWSMLNTIAFEEKTADAAIAMLQEHLEKTEGLELPAWANLKNMLGLMEYVQGSYSASIRHFYDVQLALENEKEISSEAKKELLYAEEMIANIYYLFEDYERAIELYAIVAENSDISESYSHYLNMSTAYLELNDAENAKKTALLAADSLPYLNKTEAAELEASINDTLANICIKEGNIDEAEKYLLMAEETFPKGAESLFFGGEHFLSLTRCRLLLEKDAPEEAIKLLEEMLADKDAANYGMEKEVYELLAKAYLETEETKLLADTYRTLLEMDEESFQMIRREYLDFSKYYRDVNRLERQNESLSKINTAAIAGILSVSAALAVVLLLANMLRAKNVTDQLTGIYNRKKLNQLGKKYARSGTPGKLGVIMADIDYFKRYNDTYGHPAGDEVLKSVAKLLERSVRKSNLVIRYGGEEFLLLLNGLTPAAAKEACSRIKKSLEELALPHCASDTAEYVTLSMGLCYQQKENSASLSELIKAADECLYESKQNGRNRYTFK
ncbi:MAG: diguanylate cyclase, partial [Firmicutes bacterium]|nr:diguanylate cyclase [Bacillota bacterium]